jgi:hypothetical protein
VIGFIFLIFYHRELKRSEFSVDVLYVCMCMKLVLEEILVVIDDDYDKLIELSTGKVSSHGQSTQM